MDREKRIVKLKLDIIFKRIFGSEENEDIISALISALLDIPRESIKEIAINNVEMPPESYEQKFSRLDLRMNVDDRIVNIEMQVNREPNFEDRTLFYWARLYGGELKSGEEYGELKQTICINIINFNLFDCEDYHSCFLAMEKNRAQVLSDKFAIHFFELKKLGNHRKEKPMDDWLRLINAETEGELMDIMETTTIPEVQRTIVKLKELSADEKLQQEIYYREKRLHDEATALGEARRSGIAEGMEKGMAEGMAKGMEKGRANGIAEEKKATVERMRRAGFTEEQIRAAIGE